MIDVGIDASVERAGDARPISLLKAAQQIAAGEGQVEIELRNLLAPQIVQRAGIQSAQRDRSVQVVEDMQRMRQREDLVADTCASGGIAGSDDDVGLSGLTQRFASHFVPVGVNPQIAVGTGAEIAMPGVVGSILLVKNDARAAAIECPQNGPIRRGMAVSPGRRKRQSEDRNFQDTPKEKRRRPLARGPRYLPFRWANGR